RLPWRDAVPTEAEDDPLIRDELQKLADHHGACFHLDPVRTTRLRLQPGGDPPPGRHPHRVNPVPPDSLGWRPDLNGVLDQPLIDAGHRCSLPRLTVSCADASCSAAAFN